MEDKPAKPATSYQFRIRGLLDDEWRDWFGDLQMMPDGGETILWGPVPDQAALYGIIARLSNLGLMLLSVNTCADAPALTQGESPSSNTHRSTT